MPTVAMTTISTISASDLVSSNSTDTIITYSTMTTATECMTADTTTTTTTNAVVVSLVVVLVYYRAKLVAVTKHYKHQEPSK